MVATLPNVPLATSMLSLLGASVMVGTVLHVIAQGKVPTFSGIFGLGLLLVVWIALSNPYAATEGGDRNWVFTFVQLLALTWMSGYLLRSPQRQRFLMIVFATATVISTCFVFGETVITATRAESVRSAGLSGGSNSVARYIVLSIIFLVYLRSIERRHQYRMILLGAIAILLAGLAYTLSRSGLLLLLTAGLLLAFRMMGRTNLKATTKLKIIVLAAAVSTGVIYVLPDSIFQAYSSVLQTTDLNRYRPDMESIDQNARIFLAMAGYEMWLDHPWEGVGIGQFPLQLTSYSTYFRNEIGPHNMYVNMLAETGIIGLIFFVTFLATAARQMYHASKSTGAVLNLPYIWFVCLIVLAVGGLLKHDHANKLLWLLVGMSIPFNGAAAVMRAKMRRSNTRRGNGRNVVRDTSDRGTPHPGGPDIGTTH
ncbi:MAG: O-antigen ligase family protein [Rhodothermales bacterium]